MAVVRPWSVRAEGEIVRFPKERVEGWARFDTFFLEEHERLFKALYFVTGNRADAEELVQEAFLKLWERWDQIETIEDPTVDLLGYPSEQAARILGVRPSTVRALATQGRATIRGAEGARDA
jgi:DNA-directed RNA polymerase specialized sigma24 family protein